MISARSIAFVLGAGASHCYGFPTGAQLCDLLINELRKDYALQQFLLGNTALAARHIEEFRSELSLSAQNSIDAFLEIRQEYLHVGKAAMAAKLISYETSEMLWRRDPSNWMLYLFDKMRTLSLEEFANNKVSFITFNFDRSLEHFLCTSLQHSYRGSVEECAEALKAIPIIHLHGRLGYLPWQGEPSRPYVSTVTRPPELEMCVEGIKLVHEEVQDGRDKEFEKAKDLMNAADKVYFLGFGFGQTNIDRLALIKLPQNKAMATGHGYKQHEVDSISRKINSNVSIYPELNIERIFRQNVQWD